MLCCLDWFICIPGIQDESVKSSPSQQILYKFFAGTDQYIVMPSYFFKKMSQDSNLARRADRLRRKLRNKKEA